MTVDLRVDGTVRGKHRLRVRHSRPNRQSDGSSGNTKDVYRVEQTRYHQVLRVAASQGVCYFV
jgi:hypothetical protein